MGSCKHQANKFQNEKCLAKYKLVVVVIDNPYNPAEFVVIPCSDSVVRTANTLSGYPHSQAPPSLIPRLVGMRLAPTQLFIDYSTEKPGKACTDRGYTSVSSI